ncbi:ankyrin [Lophium mytilinum]|uniref:Ankyrin n=1 Tax=Lophium mytilinum TaxID=390894 RepID=A0A6A6QX68_9PEZI|nr:ankyrin [Lophium mytilinum]
MDLVKTGHYGFLGTGQQSSQLYWINKKRREERCVLPALPGILNISKENSDPPLIIAACRRDVAMMQLLLAEGADINIRAKSRRDQTPLHTLISRRSSNLEAMEHLLREGASVDVRDRSGLTPLHCASACNDLRSIQLLVRHGADLTATCHGRSMLFFCCEQNVFRYLLSEGLDLKAKDWYGLSAMHCSLSKPSLRRYVLQRSLIQTLDYHDPVPPLYSHDEIAKGLVSSVTVFSRALGQARLKALIPLEPLSGQSPLCIAASNHLLESAEALLSLGANIDFEGCPVGSALMAANSKGDLQMVKLLVRSGAKVIYFIRQDNLWRNAFGYGEEWPTTSRWLSVRCHFGPLMLEYASQEDIQDQRQTRPWSGLVGVEISLAGRQLRSPKESSEKYLVRINKVKRSCHGKVIVAGWDHYRYPD